MEVIRSKTFRADRARGAKDIASMNGITTRLQWTDQPDKWHVNDGEEKSTVLNTGDIFFASTDTEHVAHPIGEARILVVENEGGV